MFDPLNGKPIFTKTNAHDDCVNCVRYVADQSLTCNLWCVMYMFFKSGAGKILRCIIGARRIQTEFYMFRLHYLATDIGFMWWAHKHFDLRTCRFLDTRTFATCSDDHTVRLWDARYLKHQTRTLTGHSNWVKNIEYVPDKHLLVTSGFDYNILAWDINRLVYWLKE